MMRFWTGARKGSISLWARRMNVDMIAVDRKIVYRIMRRGCALVLGLNLFSMVAAGV